ncbi:ATP-binding cassette domain-containing protein, partial [Pseudomonas syringae]
TALDVTTQVDVLAAIRNAIQLSGSAALYITHDLAVVAQMAQRIMVLKRGRLVEEAPTRQMLQAPTQPYTRSLWAVQQLTKAAEPEASSQILNIGHLSAHYGRVKVLDDISIDVPQGRTTAVIGESGSGKSTLARCITGLLGVSAGTVKFAGQPLAPRYGDRPLEQLRQIQLVYQSADTALNPRHTVRELIGRPLALYHAMGGAARQQRLLELMEMIELSPTHLSRLPGELSGGQKQRVAIARALAAEPRLIICDEVTSALDKLIQQGIINLLLRLQKELGVSYLFITHDIATVRAIADRIVVMHRGQVVQQGTRAEVLNPPHPAYTEHLLACEPQMHAGWLEAMRPAAAARLDLPLPDRTPTPR